MACSSCTSGMYFARRYLEVSSKRRQEARAVRARARSLSGRWAKDYDASECVLPSSACALYGTHAQFGLSIVCMIEITSF